MPKTKKRAVLPFDRGEFKRWQWKQAWRTVRATYQLNACHNIAMWNPMLELAYQQLEQREGRGKLDVLFERQQARLGLSRTEWKHVSESSLDGELIDVIGKVVPDASA